MTRDVIPCFILHFHLNCLRLSDNRIRQLGTPDNLDDLSARRFYCNRKHNRGPSQRIVGIPVRSASLHRIDNARSQSQLVQDEGVPLSVRKHFRNLCPSAQNLSGAECPDETHRLSDDGRTGGIQHPNAKRIGQRLPDDAF